MSGLNLEQFTIKAVILDIRKQWIIKNIVGVL
jgi:hypothetical protein